MGAAGYGHCDPKRGDFARSFWTLLAACSADPTVAAGAQGGQKSKHVVAFAWPACTYLW